MAKFNVPPSLKNNYYIFLFIISSLINSFFVLHFTIGINNIGFIFFDLLFIILIILLSNFIKHKKSYFIIISFILSTLCCINCLFYNNYMEFTSLDLLKLLRQINGMPIGAVTSVFKIKDFFFYWQFILLIILPFKSIKIKNYLYVYLLLLVMLLISINSNDIYRLKNSWNKTYVVNNFGIYNYHLWDVFNIIKDKFKDNTDDVTDYFNNQTFSDNEYTGIFKDKNIIFIHAESVQTMFLNKKINNQTITPFLNKLANEGLFFTNYYSLEGAGTSSDTEFTLNTSLLPITSKPAFINYQNNDYHSLLKEFKKNNYYTFSMHANKCDYWNRNKIYPNLGYDKFYCGDEYIKDEIIGMGLSDKSFFKQSIAKLNEINKNHDKFYGTLIALTNHTPFVSDLKFDVGYMENTKIGSYLKTLNYFDSSLAYFFDNLDKDIVDNTVFVIYGDHDAKFNKEDYEYYLGKKLDFYDYEQLTKVPFIIYSKDLKGKKIDNLMGSIDIAPTISNMFNLDKKYYLGNDIFNINDNIVVFPNGNWITNKIYYNNQLSDYKLYKEVSNEYIDYNEKIARKRIELSSKIIKNNYFKREAIK